MNKESAEVLSRVSSICRCGHPYMPEHYTSCYGCNVEGCCCREFTPLGVPAWNESDYHEEVKK